MGPSGPGIITPGAIGPTGPTGATGATGATGPSGIYTTPPATITHTTLAAFGATTTATIQISTGSAPAGTRGFRVRLAYNVDFAAPAIDTLGVKVGTVSVDDQFLSLADLLVYVGGSTKFPPDAAPGSDPYGTVAAEVIRVKVTMAGGNLNTLTQGSFTVWAEIITIPTSF